MTIPKTMRAIEIVGPGGPDVLRVTERSVPRPKAGEVLVQVAAAGVNRPDVLQRKGQYPPPPGASDIPGLELAGTIVAVGEGVQERAPGEPVCALVAGGGYAEYAAVPAGQCLPIPGGVDAVGAASLPETFFTVWINVFQRAALTAGETLLVHGGSSGIGVAAIQLATQTGHRVFVTAGTPEKCAACELLGAARAINYRSEDFVQVVKQETAGRGVDVILDMVAGDYVERDLACLAEDGRLSLIAFIGGSKATADLRPVLGRRLTITGSGLRTRSVAFKSAVARELEGRIWPLIAAGKIRPVVYRTFPLEQASAAHALMESNEHIGKIVLAVRP